MEVVRLFLIPIVKEIICQQLSFEDLIHLRDAFELSSLKYPISMIDPMSQKRILFPGINSDIISTYRLIKQFGLNEALLTASSRGCNSVVRILISVGADLETKTYGYGTALTLASIYGHASVVQTLIKAGANVHNINFCGMTALKFASRHGCDAIVKILKEAGAV